MCGELLVDYVCVGVWMCGCVGMWVCGCVAYRRTKSFETRQPQEFIKAKSDPKALRAVRIAARTVSANPVIPLCIGLTTVLTKTNTPGANIFTVGILPGDPGIGGMTIEAANNAGPFKVR